jgi:hypothetical protein
MGTEISLFSKKKMSFNSCTDALGLGCTNKETISSRRTYWWLMSPVMTCEYHNLSISKCVPLTAVRISVHKLQVQDHTEA